MSTRLKMTPLGEIGRFQAGVGFPVELQGCGSGKYPFAKVGDISRFARAGIVEIDGASNYVDEDDLATLGAVPIPEGSIVFAKIGEAIAQNFRAVTKCKMLIDNNVMALVPDRRLVDTRYLYYFLTQLDLYRLTSSTTVPALRKSTLETIRFPAPSLSEQQRIAAILDKADAIRRKRQEALDALIDLRVSQFDRWFSPLFGTTAEDDYVPVSSFVKRFEGGINLGTPERPSPDTRDFILKVSAVTWGDYRQEECKPLPSDYSPPLEHYVRAGDLLFSRANTTELVGATVYVFETPSNRVLPDKLWRFVWDDPAKVEPLFVWALFNHPRIRYEIGRRATGTSGSMKNVSMEKVLSIRVPWPQIDDQRRFARYLQEDRSLRNTMARSSEDAKHLFECLVQRAFRGEL